MSIDHDWPEVSREDRQALEAAERTYAATRARQYQPEPCERCGRAFFRTCTCTEEDRRDGIQCLCRDVRICPECFTDYADEQG